MYRYKLNNSYTVYVNWSYYSEAAKICQKAHHKVAASKVKSSSAKTKIMPAPLPNGTKVSSQFFGEGTICSTSKDGIVSVAFPSRMVRFIYSGLPRGQGRPYERGFLTDGRCIQPVGIGDDTEPCAVWYGERQGEG